MLMKLPFPKPWKVAGKFNLPGGIRMFFRKKVKLRKEFDDKLLQQLHELRNVWNNQNVLVERCVDPTVNVCREAKLAEVKYFFSIKEAKSRNLSLRK